MMFSGSYAATDVQFLLKRVSMANTGIAEKERHIQTGGHYSEVLTLETAPTPDYEALFAKALANNASRFARDVRRLACEIDRSRPNSRRIAVVSLARAGTPVGVLAHRTLTTLLRRASTHYCVSIIRDRGLDCIALAHILQRHAPEDVVFVDGWTGKGVIGRELCASVSAFNEAYGVQVDPALFVVGDIAGTAHFSATGDDYLLPSAVLNSTVSGLISRTVLTPEIGAEDFHGCAYYAHLEPHDRSRWFVDVVFDAILAIGAETGSEAVAEHARTARQAALNSMLNTYMDLFGITDLNRIKPGVGEATRVMLRRAPRHLIVRNPDNPDVGHLLHLARVRGTALTTDSSLPCEAVAIIDKAD